MKSLITITFCCFSLLGLTLSAQTNDANITGSTNSCIIQDVNTEGGNITINYYSPAEEVRKAREELEKVAFEKEALAKSKAEYERQLQELQAREQLLIQQRTQLQLEKKEIQSERQLANQAKNELEREIKEFKVLISSIQSQPFDQETRQIIADKERSVEQIEERSDCIFEDLTPVEFTGDNGAKRVGFSIKEIYERGYFLRTSAFREGLAVACLSNKCGFIDPDGQLKIHLKYDEAKPYSEGLAAVKNNGEWFYINKMGESMFSERFSEAYSFQSGVAVVKKSDNLQYLINRQGKTISAGFDEIGPLDQLGRAVVYEHGRYSHREKFGWINMSGKTIFDPLFEYDQGIDTIFREYLLVSTDGYVNVLKNNLDLNTAYNLYKIYDKEFNDYPSITKEAYENFIIFLSENRYLINKGRDYENDFLIVDSHFRPITMEGVSVNLTSFSDFEHDRETGIGATLTKSNQLFLVNVPTRKILFYKNPKGWIPVFKKWKKKGKQRILLSELELTQSNIDDQFFHLKLDFPFTGGIEVPPIQFLLKKTGNTFQMLSEKPYNDISELTNHGLIRVQDSEGLYGFINFSGKEVITCQYSKADEAFNNYGYLKASKSGESVSYGFIDTNNQVIIPFEYYKNSLQTPSEGLFAFKEGSKWGVKNLEGKVIIPPKYVDIGHFQDGIAIVQDSWGSYYGLINVNDLQIFPPRASAITRIGPGEYQITAAFQEHSLSGKFKFDALTGRCLSERNLCEEYYEFLKVLPQD